MINDEIHKKIEPALAQRAPSQPTLVSNAEHEIIDFTSALPDRFEFYSLGSVQLQTPNHEQSPLRETSGILYVLEGDCRVFLTLFPKIDLDLSVYSEMGNIIAAKMALSLEKSKGIEWMISPPRILNRNEIEQIKTISSQHQAREYLHADEDRKVSIPLLITLPMGGEIGNA